MEDQREEICGGGGDGTVGSDQEGAVQEGGVRHPVLPNQEQLPPPEVRPFFHLGGDCFGCLLSMSEVLEIDGIITVR